MIQRIQSLYWFLATILLGLFYFCDFAYVKSVVSSITLSTFYGIQSIPTEAYSVSFNTWPLHVLVILATLITFITIFLFKRRTLQIRLSAVAMVLDLGLLGMAYFYYRMVAGEVIDGLASLSILYLLPFIALILTFLGITGVKKDIAILSNLKRL